MCKSERKQVAPETRGNHSLKCE